jgi:hypothetical protein
MIPLRNITNTRGNMRIRVFDIEYDTDGVDAVSMGLPSSLEFEVDDDAIVQDIAADMVSDETGWAVTSCMIERIDLT